MEKRNKNAFFQGIRVPRVHKNSVFTLSHNSAITSWISDVFTDVNRTTGQLPALRMRISHGCKRFDWMCYHAPL